MLLPRFQQVYTPQNASAIALLLLTTFFFFDSYHWHILPFPWYPSTSSTTNPNDLQSNSNDSTNIVLTTLTTVNKLNSTNASLVGGANETIPNKLNQSRKSNNIATNASHASPTTMAFPESNSTASTIHPPPEILSLRRLEAGLRTARSALRKVVLEKNATRALQAQELTGEYSPWGPIYRDASIFQQSYLEMEKRFRVFVYPEGEEPLVHNGPCKEIYSTEGRFIQELQETNPFVTKDPLKAHVFFLPFSVSMMVTYLYKPKSRDMSPLLHFVKDYVEVVATKYPFWNRSQGADHFMLSCHDWGPHVSKAHPHLEKHAIRVLCNANRSEGYVPDKDASLAEINLVGGYIPAELGGPPMKERPHLAFFAGQDHGPVRPILYKYWEGKDDDVKVFHKVPAEYSYQDLMKKSKFCLCPGGYEVNSPRIVEAIYNDCIPVVIADSFVLPFSDVLDWDAFSLRVMENDIPKLKKILQAVPVAKYEEMQERVRQVQRHFLLNQPPQRYDLFHMILHSVWLRRLNIRLNYY